MTASINGTTGVTFPDASTQATAATGFGFKNRLINGNFGIWQRGTSFSANGYTADRWSMYSGTSPVVSQSTDVPASPVFKYSASVSGTGSSTGLTQKIESANATDLSGQNVTVSFWLKQSTGAGSNAVAVTLAYATAVDNFGGTTNIASQNITTTSSWAYYSLTFSSLPSSVANGLQLNVSTTGAGAALFLITGVQLEKGSTATSFDYRPYGTELALCQRYYQVVRATWSGNSTSGENYVTTIPYQATMRATPTATSSDVVNLGFNSGATFNNLSVYGGYVQAVCNATNTGRIFTRDCSLSAEL